MNQIDNFARYLCNTVWRKQAWAVLSETIVQIHWRELQEPNHPELVTPLLARQYPSHETGV